MPFRLYKKSPQKKLLLWPDLDDCSLFGTISIHDGFQCLSSDLVEIPETEVQ